MKYIYIGHDKTNVKHNGIISIGYEITEYSQPRENIKGEVEFTFAFCKKNDPFIKSIAYKIISDRFNSHTIKIYTDSFNYYDIKKYIIKGFCKYNHVYKQLKFIPSWAYDMFYEHNEFLYK